MPTYKDINELTQKSSVSGTEKLPVSDTEFITPEQITDNVTSIGQNYIPRCTFNDSGGINGNPDWFIGKDYIPVANGDTIVWNPGVANWGGYLCLYDSDKNFLNNYSANAAERTIVLNNADVAYIRAPFYMDNLASAKIVLNGVTVWTPSDKANGVKKDLQDLSNDVDALLGEKNIPFFIQNGTPGNFNNTNYVLLRGADTVTIPGVPGHKYRIRINKTPNTGYNYYFRLNTYSTVSPASFTANRIRTGDEWDIYYMDGEDFTLNSNEYGFTLLLGEKTEPSDSGTFSPLRESDFADGDIVIIDVTNSRLTESDPTVPSWAKAATKPTYTASEVGALPNTTSIPSALSDLSEDTTHRVVTDTEKSTWNAKQNAITVSSSEPTSSQGSDGDIWIVI